MKNAFRYVMVGMLVCGMAVDQATARRLFQRRCCRPKCVATCPAPCHVDPCDSPVVTEHCAPTCSGCADPACEHCAVEAPAEVVTQEYVPPTPVPADTYGPIDQYTPTEAPTPVAEDPTPAPEATMPPAPLAVPEQDDVAAPAPVEPPPVETAPADVGDRYSNDIFSPTLPEEDEPAEPPADPAPQEDDTEDIFSEPTSPSRTRLPQTTSRLQPRKHQPKSQRPRRAWTTRISSLRWSPMTAKKRKKNPADEPIESQPKSQSKSRKSRNCRRRPSRTIRLVKRGSKRPQNSQRSPSLVACEAIATASGPTTPRLTNARRVCCKSRQSTSCSSVRQASN